jgi:hypothetical protein
LEPKSGEHFFAYGSDQTLASLRSSLPPGLVFHGHGSGIGVAVVDEAVWASEPDLADRLARDTIAFDQRGCLSPRWVLFRGGATRAAEFAGAVAERLAVWQRDVPLGRLLEGEQAELARYRAALSYLCDVFPAGAGMVAVDGEGRPLPLPPTGRNLLVSVSKEPCATISSIAPAIAGLGVAGHGALTNGLRAAAPNARMSKIGLMQRPPLDGPVDLRTRAVVL